MNHPFQCITTVTVPSTGISYLLAASGQTLLSTCLPTGEVKAEWTASEQSIKSITEDTRNEDGESGEGPSKKQKLSTESIGLLPSIIKLHVSPDQSHAVAVTDDKNVRVFSIHNDGSLAELSARAMPKRPCAIQILPDNATILCGDKFGDVYSLPLLPKEVDTTLDEARSDPSKETERSFKPSATRQTVHTKRNLKSLEAQLKQKNVTSKAKQPLAFEHQLLLGHVSMLTDVAHATHEVDGKQRNYIITADRDEHIRISRGPPQCHIIEGYCLGHKSFISKICAIPETNLLLSGGGDEWLGLWEWPDFRLKSELWDFAPSIRAQLKDNKNYTGDEPEHIAVSGIWPVSANSDDGQPEYGVMVACEGLPVLVDCAVSELVKASKDDGPIWSFQSTEYPILDITCVNSVMYVSYDAREKDQRPLRAYQIRSKRSASGTGYIDIEEDHGISAILEQTVDKAVKVDDGKKLDSVLYGVANLRKRAHKEDDLGEDANGVE